MMNRIDQRPQHVQLERQRPEGTELGIHGRAVLLDKGEPMAHVAGRLDQCAGLTLPQAHSRLRAVPGIGVWTAAEVAQRALGDADAVSFGDFHVAKDVGWALIGRPVDDAGLAELLEPYAGHRFRVQHLLALAGHRRARRAPRMAPRTHLPVRAR